jgi:hypothetical protein
MELGRDLAQDVDAFGFEPVEPLGNGRASRAPDFLHVLQVVIWQPALPLTSTGLQPPAPDSQEQVTRAF